MSPRGAVHVRSRVLQCGAVDAHMKNQLHEWCVRGYEMHHRYSRCTGVTREEWVYIETLWNVTRARLHLLQSPLHSPAITEINMFAQVCTYSVCEWRYAHHQWMKIIVVINLRFISWETQRDYSLLSLSLSGLSLEIDRSMSIPLDGHISRSKLINVKVIRLRARGSMQCSFAYHIHI